MQTRIYVPRTRPELIDLHASLLLRSPDYKEESKKERIRSMRDLEDYFEAFRNGVDIVYKNPEYEYKRQKIHEMVNEIYFEYSEGNVTKGQLKCMDLIEFIERKQVKSADNRRRR